MFYDRYQQFISFSVAYGKCHNITHVPDGLTISHSEPAAEVRWCFFLLSEDSISEGLTYNTRMNF